jgi:hypothetical protein
MIKTLHITVKEQCHKMDIFLRSKLLITIFCFKVFEKLFNTTNIQLLTFYLLLKLLILKRLTETPPELPSLRLVDLL